MTMETKRWLGVVAAMAVFGGQIGVPATADACMAAPPPEDHSTGGDPECPITQGTLLTTDPQGRKVEVPLKHTEVQAEVSGLVSSVTVTQQFHNPFTDKIEAVYVFPLPENAAVYDMVMKIGDRTIRGLIKERGEARQIYEQAKQTGHVASLLEQERLNLFTQSVANIEPGKEIDVTISYVQVLKYDRGEYEFSFPMVVGPRYIPGSSTVQQSSGGGWAQDTDRVPDASRITPPVLKPGQRSGHDIQVRLILDAGVAIQGLTCPSHDVKIEREGEQRAEIRLSPRDTIPNKDLVVRYGVAGKKPETGLLTHRDERGGFFLMMIQPQASFQSEEITPKEMVFVLDISGSMSGEPIAKVKQAMRHAIRSMNPNDTFQIIKFSSTLEKYSPQPVPNTLENVESALSYINGINAGGGTEMLQPILEALKAPEDPKRLRIVCLMTDAYIGNEEEILKAIQTYSGKARTFVFGVGSSVNRYLIEEAGIVGRGAGLVFGLQEDTKQVVERFYDRIARPSLTDIEIDWGKLPVKELYPSGIPDLFAFQPVILVGRYETAARETVTLRGKITGKEVEYKIPVAFTDTQEANGSIASLWARTKITDLLRQKYAQNNPDVVKAVTELALKFRLMSPYTSFVAVEEKEVTEGNNPPRKVLVAVQMPEGVSYDGVFGRDQQNKTTGPPSLARAGASMLTPAPVEYSESEKLSSDRLAVSGLEESRSKGTGQGPSFPTGQAGMATTIPEFTLELAWGDAGKVYVTITKEGEIWLTQVIGGQTSRRMVRKLTVAEVRELWQLLNQAGLSRYSGQRLGQTGLTTSVELTLQVSGKKIVLLLQGVEGLPQDLQPLGTRLSSWLGPWLPTKP